MGGVPVTSKEGLLGPSCVADPEPRTSESSPVKRLFCVIVKALLERGTICRRQYRLDIVRFEPQSKRFGKHFGYTDVFTVLPHCFEDVKEGGDEQPRVCFLDET